ncbi:MAG: hypothetical protein ABI333_14565 [bacterium]
MDLPACGIYRTTEEIGSVPANRLVYFHNHGNPGPGVYLPESWSANRVRFSEKGTPLPAENLAFTLEPLLAEGLYRVRESFTCCEKGCRTYQEELLVQLGYDGSATPLLFVPQWTETGLAIPQLGNKLDRDRLDKLAPLKVAVSKKSPPDSVVH